MQERNLVKQCKGSDISESNNCKYRFNIVLVLGNIFYQRLLAFLHPIYVSLDNETFGCLVALLHP
jgi:hypothetical protein